MTKKIPFFPNHPDGTHCYQAALRMVLSYFTDKEWSMGDLVRLTGKSEGKWTWPTTSLLWLLENGFEVRLIEKFSYADFARRGKDYLIEKCGREVADAQEVNSDLERERELAARFTSKGTVEFRMPTYENLECLLKDGYLTICNINASIISKRERYSGHFVVPTGLTEEKIIFHDPGLPPIPFREATRTLFEKAWGYPTKHEKNILAVRPVRRGG